ncbi:MAG: PEP-CTERM sorting domain-containing protein, partial [Proteobacteria bacterium]|nr:PEP-CTERM sorting domain-containing protein [Pseudomonadota bacterium]
TGSIGNVVVEVYRVFPKDSDTVRTPNVPTRVNSPSDVAFTSRDAAGSSLTFATSVLAADFTAANSVQPGGIHPSPGQTTGGNGPIRGQEVEVSVTFSTPIDLPADHYFFVPQVDVTGGEFYWLSGTRPIVAPGTPFAPDLQAWTRDAALDPDWLRIGTDIFGGPTPSTFNQAFTLTGTVDVPEPLSIAVLLPAVLAMAGVRRRGGQRGQVPPVA